MDRKKFKLGKCWIYKGDENKKIKKEELENFISLGWLKGRICNELRNRKCIRKK